MLDTVDSHMKRRKLVKYTVTLVRESFCFDSIFVHS